MYIYVIRIDHYYLSILKRIAENSKKGKMILR